jgi:hypothetical protein
LGLAFSWAQIRRRLFGPSVVPPYVPGIPTRPRFLLVGVGFAVSVAASVGMWMRYPPDTSGKAQGAGQGVVSASVPANGSAATLPIDSAPAVTVTHVDFVPAVSSARARGSEMKTPPPVSSLPSKRGPLVVEHHPSADHRADPKRQRSKAKAAESAPASEFFRTMGDD